MTRIYHRGEPTIAENRWQNGGTVLVDRHERDDIKKLDMPPHRGKIDK